MSWICCQIGAREHYAIPRALHRASAVSQLITDAWLSPSSIRAIFAKGRFNGELSDAPVTAFNFPLVQFELLARARRLHGWDKVIARNEWFQGKTLQWLERNAEKLKAETLTAPPNFALRTSHSAPVIFSYSYAARDIFVFAKAQGWKTILGQIDPGPVEEEIVRAEHEVYPEFSSDWSPAPLSYWQSWREECELADRIIVNSEWSRSCLVQAGVSGSRLFVIPLAYQSPITNSPITRAYPPRFTRERPLRILFLGQINLRKGAAQLLEAAQAMQNEPVEFWMVGPKECRPPERVRDLKNVGWIGRVAHTGAAKYYREADVFILPTLSDGFALTQLEAQAHGLPVIASRRCGEVVHDGVNGIILEQSTPDAIVAALRFCLGNPDRLASLSAASRVEPRFSIDALSQNLLSIGLVP